MSIHMISRERLKDSAPPKHLFHTPHKNVCSWRFVDILCGYIYNFFLFNVCEKSSNVRPSKKSYGHTMT